MTLRIKTLLVGGLTLITLIGVLYAISSRFLLSGFELIEKQETTEGVQRAEQGLNNIMLRLNDNLSGWSQWNNSVEFVRSNNPQNYRQYVAANLNDAVVLQFKSDIVIYVQNNGHVVYATGFDQKTRTKVPPPSDIFPHLRANSPLLKHRDSISSNQGILVLNRGPLLLVSRPIVKDAGKGPIYGSLLWGRFLNNSEISKVTESIQQPVSVQPLEKVRLLEDFHVAQSHLKQPRAVYVNPLNENTVAGYTILEDIYDEPSLLLRVETKRDIFQQGLISIRFVLVALLSVGLIGGGLALWSLERWVLARLSRLSYSVETISNSGDISVRVPITGRDELSKLAGSVNKLLATAEKGQSELRFEIAERQNAEQALRQSRDELETRVLERTNQYVQANTQLQNELAERQRTEENLRQAQEMLQLVINHIPQAIFWKDRQLVFLGANDRFAHNAGYNSPEELIGLNDFDISGDSAEAFRADDMEVIESDSPKLNIEESLRKADGNLIWLRTNKIPIHDSTGTVVGVLGSYEDITPQKEVEEAIHQARKEADAANAAKSEFLSRMSHELRTPLNAILGFGQILDGQQLRPMQKESVGYILKGGRHLLSLINEVLDIARVEAGRMELSLEAVELTELLSESCALVRPIANERQIKLYQNLPLSNRCYVLADQQRLKQVFINLISNAIKYNHVGGEVAISVENKPDNQIRISVRDTGFGISEENLARLFTPFERLNASHSDIEGTGLGLALSQKLVTAMGGTLDVKSTLGQGSTFFIELPTAGSETEPLFSTASQCAEDDSIEQMERVHNVLYIEDNLSNLRLIEILLKTRPNLKLMSAMQGSIGLDLARQHLPDLILLDLNLPDMHGMDVMNALQKSASTKDIPVIVISADVTSVQIERMLENGAKAYLGKPLDVSKFFHTVNEVLGVDCGANSESKLSLN